MMRALLMYVLILFAIWEINARQVTKLHPYGKEDKDDFLIFYKHLTSNGDLFGDKATFRYPQAGALYKFKITRITVKDYNPYFATVDLLSGGPQNGYAEFKAQSPNSRELDLEFFIYGIYKGSCCHIKKFDNYTISLNRKGYMHSLVTPIH